MATTFNGMLVINFANQAFSINFVTKNSTYYKNELSSGKMEVIGKFKSKGEEYDVLNSNFVCSGNFGLGYFCPSIGVGYADANFGLLGCASEEIAQHFGRYFGMLITKAKFGDITDFEVIEDYTQK